MLIELWGYYLIPPETLDQGLQKETICLSLRYALLVLVQPMLALCANLRGGGKQINRGRK